MPYDPIKDAPRFRAILKRLAEAERPASQAIIRLFNKQRTHGDYLSVSRATPDRLIPGEDVTKIRELRVIEATLRAHAAFGAYFEPDAPAQTNDANAFARVLGAFFALAEAAGDDARPADLVVAMPGQFILMRRDRDSISLENGVRVSSLLPQAVEGGVMIEES